MKKSEPYHRNLQPQERTRLGAMKLIESRIPDLDQVLSFQLRGQKGRGCIVYTAHVQRELAEVDAAL